jgi:hypothetical protein
MRCRCLLSKELPHAMHMGLLSNEPFEHKWRFFGEETPMFGWSVQDGLQTIHVCSGSQFHPVIVFWNFVNVLVAIFPLCSLQGMQVSLFGHWIQFQSISLVYVFWSIVWYLLIEQDDSAEWRKKQVCKTITFLFKDLSLSHFWISAVLLY